jgi:hypothetical protein
MVGGVVVGGVGGTLGGIVTGGRVVRVHDAVCTPPPGFGPTGPSTAAFPLSVATPAPTVWVIPGAGAGGTP